MTTLTQTAGQSLQPRRSLRGLDTAHISATLLMAAIAAALIVVANQVVENWTDGHLLAAWILMWAVSFGLLALMVAPARRSAARLSATIRGWSAARRQRAQDEAYWNAALADARIMADISRAMSHAADDEVRASI